MLRGVIHYKGDAKVARKAQAGIVKEAMAAAIDWWHQDRLPLHFKRGASFRYKYRKRNAKYLKQKMRKLGHTQDLVLSGKMQRMVTSRIKITSNRKGGRGALYGPTYLYQHRRDMSDPDKAAELTTTTRKEVLDMAKLVDKHVTGKLEKLPQKRTERG